MTLYVVLAEVIAYIEADSENEARALGEELDIGEWDSLGDITVAEDRL